MLETRSTKRKTCTASEKCYVDATDRGHSGGRDGRVVVVAVVATAEGWPSTNGESRPRRLYVRISGRKCLEAVVTLDRGVFTFQGCERPQKPVMERIVVRAPSISAPPAGEIADGLQL